MDGDPSGNSRNLITYCSLCEKRIFGVAHFDRLA